MVSGKAVGIAAVVAGSVLIGGIELSRSQATGLTLGKATIAVAESSITVGDTDNFSCNAYDQNGNPLSGVSCELEEIISGSPTAEGNPVTTSSSGVATVSNFGPFTTPGVYTFQFAATYKGVVITTGTATVTVTAAAPVLGSVSLSVS